MTDPSSKGGRVLVGVAPMRLAVGLRDPLPTPVADEAHERVVDQALHWQQAAGHAVFWEMGAAAQRAEEGRAYALAGQMASAGEQLGLAHAAAVEVALWRDAREGTAPDPADEMCMRAMAEAQCLFVIGTGHALANLAVRALALNRTLKEELCRKLRRGQSRPTLDPFSQNRADWVSLNAGTCSAVRAVARTSGAKGAVRLVEPVVNVGTGQAWKALQERRGEDFHRWRPQSHGIESVPRTSPWERGDRSRSLSISHPLYGEAQGLADETARVASEAMLALARAMEAFMQAWPSAAVFLGGPKFELAQGGESRARSADGRTAGQVPTE